MNEYGIFERNTNGVVEWDNKHPIEMQIKILLFLFVMSFVVVVVDAGSHSEQTAYSLMLSTLKERRGGGICNSCREETTQIVDYRSILTNCYTIAKR